MASQRLRALLEERVRVWDRMQEIRTQAEKNENGELSAEQRTNWDEASTRLTELSGDIEREQRGDEFQREMERVAAPQIRAVDDVPEVAREARYAEAFTSFAKWGRETLTPEHRSILSSGYVPDSASPETRALSIATATAGGYTVPPGFRDTLIETLKWYGSVRSVATEIATDSGQPLQWPTFNGTGQIGRILAENVQLTQTDPIFGTAALSAYMYTSDLVLAPIQFLQDSAINPADFLARNLGMRIGRIQNQHFSTGTGVSQPLGIATNAAVGATAAVGNTTSLSYASLVQVVHSVDPAYRYGGNAKWMLHDLSLQAAQLIVDSQGRPIWQPSMQVGSPDMLLGYPMVVNNDLATPAANAKSVLFGDFTRGYIVRDVLGLNVRRLDERWADYLQIGWFAYSRCDATVQDSTAYKALAQSAT